MLSILCHRRLRSQADSVANLPDGSDKFSQRNPKIDFREYERRLLVAKPPPAIHCRHCKIVDFAIEPGIKGSPVAVCLIFVLCYEMKRRLSYSDDKNDMKHRLFCNFFDFSAAYRIVSRFCCYDDTGFRGGYQR